MREGDVRDDTLDSALARLGTGADRPRGADPTRERCRAALAARRARERRLAAVAVALRGAWTLLEPALVSALVLLLVAGAGERVLLVYLH